MATGGQAFFKGGFGCIALFFAVGILCVLIGGSMHFDIGGLLVLLVIGGVIGLIVNAVYNSGRRQGIEEAGAKPAGEDEPRKPADRPHPDDLS